MKKTFKFIVVFSVLFFSIFICIDEVNAASKKAICEYNFTNGGEKLKLNLVVNDDKTLDTTINGTLITDKNSVTYQGNGKNNFWILQFHNNDLNIGQNFAKKYIEESWKHCPSLSIYVQSDGTTIAINYWKDVSINGDLPEGFIEVKPSIDKQVGVGGEETTVTPTFITPCKTTYIHNIKIDGIRNHVSVSFNFKLNTAKERFVCGKGDVGVEKCATYTKEELKNIGETQTIAIPLLFKGDDGKTITEMFYMSGSTFKKIFTSDTTLTCPTELKYYKKTLMSTPVGSDMPVSMKYLLSFDDEKVPTIGKPTEDPDKDSAFNPNSGNSSEGWNCNKLLGQPIVDFLNGVFLLIKIAGPILCIILSMVDYIKAITGKDDDALKKANKHLVLRLVIVLIIFMLPTLVNAILSLILGGSNMSCGIH